MLDDRIIEQVIEGNNIVSVVEQYVPLKKSGANYKACCPFHEEKTPSFVVSDAKQLFKCFGCGKGGNVIHFVKEIERISFYEALEKLAGRIGLKLRSQKAIDPARRSKIGLLKKAYQLASEYYQENLQKHGSIPLDYLKDRHITPELANKFGLGYALNSASGLYNYLIKHEINKTLLEESGLFTKGQYGMTDLFRDRVIFPIHSINEEIVAFGSRKLNENTYGGKYVNSPTTPIYTKGNELYGLHLTKNEIGKKNAAIVTEGYFDLMRLYEKGFTNSVATLGTALTENQISLVGRYTKNFYLLFDGDVAGRNAALKNAGIILVAGFNPLITELPLNEDADSYLLKSSPEALTALLDKAKPLVQFIQADNSLGFSEREKIDFLINTVQEINDKIAQELLIQAISENFNLSPSSIRSRLKKIRRKEDTVAKSSNQLDELVKHKYIEEKNFLIHLINRSDLEGEDIEDINSDLFLVENYKKIFDTLRSSRYIIENKSISTVLADLEEADPEQVKILSELSLSEVPPNTFSSTLRDMKLRKYRYDLKMIQGKSINNEMSEEERFRIKMELLERIRDLSDRVVNKTIQRSLDD